MKWTELCADVETWARARKIIPNSTPEVQLLKCMSELGELADAMIKRDREGIIDGFGDVLVTLILAAKLYDPTLELKYCLDQAYDTIKDRRGTLMPNGVFVKEENHG